MRREVEAKFEVPDTDKVADVEGRLAAAGFELESVRRELDLVPDTPDHAFRKHGLLLRFRRIEAVALPERVLVTLKVKRATTTVQDNDEYEFWLDTDEDASQGLSEINSVITSSIALALPQELLMLSSFEQVYRFAFKDLGFTFTRALVEKARQEFRRGRQVVTIDTFPDGIGTYIELETYTPNELQDLVDELHLPSDKLESRNYGQIVRSKKGGTAIDQRTCLFPETRQIIDTWTDEIVRS